MADLARMELALRNADAAGDVEAARTIAQAIRQAQTSQPASSAVDSAAHLRPEAMRANLKSNVLGAIRGAGSIGATLATPIDMLFGNTSSIGNPERRQAMDAGARSLGADTESMSFKVPKFATELLGTWGLGGLAGQAVGKAIPQLGQAIATGGMSTGAASVGRAAQAADLAIRTAGGAANAGLVAGAINPDDAALGAGIGAAVPGVVKLAGLVGRGVGSAYRGIKAKPENVLREALGLSDDEFKQLIAAAKAAPDELLPGSKMTLAQALESQGVKIPGVKMLERVVSGGPGGDELLKRYATQGEARISALKGQGAQTYQGAAAEEATKAGDKIGAILRTQASDDKGAARAAWESVYGRAAKDGVKLRLPLDEFNDALRPLGPGTVGAGADARSLLAEAQKIGQVTIPADAAVKAGPAPLTLAQAVRRAGGLSMKDNDGLLGELKGLRGDLKNLVRKNGGVTPGRMAEKMREAGYIPDEDASTLLNALREDSRGLPQMSDFDDLGQQLRFQSERFRAPRPERTEPVAVPFDAFQRLRRSAGNLGAKLSERAGGETEAAVLIDMQNRLAGRVDDAVAGNMFPDEFITPEFARQYGAARDMTRVNAERYKGGNNIASILRKPTGQDYTLTGDEIFRKLWHGGGGLEGDVRNLKGVLSDSALDPAMDSLRTGIMTEAAGKTTASGQFGAALPKYVEARMPGLQEALKPEQLKVLQDVAKDIRNAEAAGSVAGLRGSDTQAKITRALDAGLIDGPLLKTLAKVLSFKGVGLESLRAKVAEAAMQSKGAKMAGLLGDPKAAAAALDSAPMSGLLGRSDPAALGLLYRGAPYAAGL